MRWLVHYFYLFCLVSSAFAANGESGELWLIEENSLKIGKRESYEAQMRARLKNYAAFVEKKGSPSVFGVQDLNNPQYLYLTPVRDFTSLGTLMQLHKEFQATFEPADLARQQRELNSTMNFKVYSLHRLLPNASYIPQGSASSLLDLPHYHYFVIGIVPGNEAFFEEHLSQMVGEFRAKKSRNCWRSWKVLLGSDVPKYVICIFAQTAEALDKQSKELQFITPALKDIVRRKREGRALLRQDLSYTPSR